MVCLRFQLPTTGVGAARRSSGVTSLGLISSGVMEYCWSRPLFSGFQVKVIFLLSSLQLTPLGEVPIHLESRIIFSTVSLSSFWAKSYEHVANRNRVRVLF